MKTKFDQLKEQQTLSENQVDDEEKVNESDVDASTTMVSVSRGGKLTIIFASILLTIVVIYFLFFKAEKLKTTEKLEEVKPSASSIAPPPTEDSFLEDDKIKEDDFLSDKSNMPEVPKLPELPKIEEPASSSGILPVILDLSGGVSKTVTQPNANEVNNESSAQAIGPSNPYLSGSQSAFPATAPNQNSSQTVIQGPLFDANNKAQSGEVPALEKTQSAPDSRRSPIVIIKGAAGPGIGVGYENNIRKLKEDPINLLDQTKSKIVPTVIKDLSTTITQGKIMTAVLETAINTEVPGNVRAVVSRDVYGESGDNILIPRGSRLYGSYSSKITRGQARVEIDWTRLIRSDGVDMAINSNASDQFGRAGVSGDIDNKYGSILGNSILTSVLAVAGAIAAEKISGNNGINTTTTDPATGTTTTTGSASSKAIYDVTKTIIDTAGQVIGNTIDMRPVIRIPQGTRITIVVNQDMNLPAIKN